MGWIIPWKNWLSYEKWQKRRAYALWKRGKVVDAGKLLAREGYSKEASEIFEKNGYIENAANLLEGVEKAKIYQRHGLWARAGLAFQEAGENLLAARCFERCHAYERAAGLYEKMGEKRSTGAMWEASGDWVKAWSCYENEEDKLQLLEKSTQEIGVLWTQPMQDLAIKFVKEGRVTSKVAEILHAHGQLSEILWLFLEKNEDELFLKYTCPGVLTAMGKTSGSKNFSLREAFRKKLPLLSQEAPSKEITLDLNMDLGLGDDPSLAWKSLLMIATYETFDPFQKGFMERKGFFFLLKGNLSAHFPGEEESRTYEPGSFLGLSAIVFGKMGFHFFTNSWIKLAYIPREKFFDLCRDKPEDVSKIYSYLFKDFDTNQKLFF